MSIAFLADKLQSKTTKDELHDIAAKLNISVTNDADAEAYLLLLQSMEVVLQRLEDSSDYIHPSLVPVPTTKPREYWVPKANEEENPLNAWRHRCDLVASNPTSFLLQGRAIAVKDNISIGGLPTTLGTFAEVLSKKDGTLPISPIDASVVSRVLEAGATIKGSSTCENFCASPLSYTSATGPVHSPWKHGYTSGGSSSGSASLLAANLIEQQNQTSHRPFGPTVDLAIGGDQGGSIRIPASYTGIYGLKPTFGLIPYTGGASLAPLIDHLGPMAQKLEDIALLLQVLAGYDGIDQRMTPESPLRSQVLNYPGELSQFRSRQLAEGEKLGSGFKVGLLLESFDIPGLAPEVRDLVIKSAKTYFEKAGASVSEISVPMHKDGVVIWTAATRMSMSEWACQGRPGSILQYLPPHIHVQWPPDQRMFDILSATNPALINIIFSGPFLSKNFGPVTEAKAHRKVFELRAAYDKVLDDYDVLVTPCTPTVAMPHPSLHTPTSSVMEKVNVALGITTNTAPFNITGHPAMSVPCGLSPAANDPELKLPVGMQVIGKRFDEMSVLKAAAIFEEGRKD